MTTVTHATPEAINTAIQTEGFAFVQGSAMRDLLASAGPLTDWPAFVESWNHLALDSYMADGGRYRRRRHAVFTTDAGAPVTRTEHQPHFQALDYNPLNGGVARWFEPIESAPGDGASLTTILRFCRRLFDTLGGGAFRWKIEVHQFRIEARHGERGQPTPEGLHRDGVNFVLVLLINRRNIARGVTTIHDLHGAALGSFTLTDPFDAALVDDTRVAHGVTPVEAIDPDAPAYRDVLVVTFKST
jgi:hypothetical protein